MNLTNNKFDLNNIKLDDKIKNYKVLTEVLGVEYKGGKAKEQQLKEISRFIKFIKIGCSYIIKEIYDNPLPKIDNRQNKIYKK